MDIILDRVQGHEFDSSVYQGTLIRAALVDGLPLGTGSVPNSLVLTAVLSAPGCPQKGDPYNFADPVYRNYLCQRHTLRAINANQAVMLIYYIWNGLLVLEDSSTLTSVQTQIDPKTKKPLYINYTPGGSSITITKLATMTVQVPIRHITASQTIDYSASVDVINAFPSVNLTAWNGKPVGYWLFSGLDGGSNDNGITYSYSVVLTTKVTENWMALDFMADDTGQPVYVDPAKVATLKAKDYAYGPDNSVDGLLYEGFYPMVEFNDLFGFTTEGD